VNVFDRNRASPTSVAKGYGGQAAPAGQVVVSRRDLFPMVGKNVSKVWKISTQKFQALENDLVPYL